MNFCIRTRVVAKCTESPDLLERLLDVSREIDLCKKALVAFLEGKRKKFSRFYFVSEAVLLDILSSSSEPDKLAAHIPKIFPATKELVVSVTEAAGSTSIVATGYDVEHCVAICCGLSTVFQTHLCQAFSSRVVCCLVSCLFSKLAVGQWR